MALGHGRRIGTGSWPTRSGGEQHRNFGRSSRIAGGGRFFALSTKRSGFGKSAYLGHGSFKRDFMGKLLASWVDEFSKHHPNVTFENRMYGTASAIGALYSGAADIAILGEEISPAALRAFRRAKGYDPTAIEVATGSVDVNFYDYAHMIFVHRDNPIKGMTLKQLEAVFGEENRRGGGPVRDWGGLGLKGQWRGRAIQPDRKSVV